MTDIDNLFEGLDPSEAMAKMGAVLMSASGRAMLLRAEALQLQSVVAAKLDEADALELADKLKEFTDAKESVFLEAEALEQQAEAAVSPLINAERDAEDKLRAATEHARKSAEAERKVSKGRSTPEQQTEALMRARAAVDVQHRAQAAYEGAKAAREAAEKHLVSARQHAEAMEAEYRAAFALKANPPKAPQSATTGIIDGFRRSMLGEELSPAARGTVEILVKDYCRRTGLDRVFAAKGREQVEAELQQKATAFLPKAGSSARSRTVGVDVIPVRPVG